MGRQVLPYICGGPARDQSAAHPVQPLRRASHQHGRERRCRRSRRRRGDHLEVAGAGLQGARLRAQVPSRHQGLRLDAGGVLQALSLCHPNPQAEVSLVAHPLRFGLKASGQDISIEALRAVWRIADDAGFDHLWDFDHLASIGPGGPDRPIYEGWALQAAMAQATRRVRIGCLVTGNTYRNPALLVKLAVTVDHLSGGRLEFGIGAAWAEIEHEMYGIEGLDHRVGRFSESLQILRSLWTEPRTNFEGRYYTMRDAVCIPKPVQQPHPPIWIGAGGDR